MIPIIYYAHSITIYNTEREQDELKRLREYFSNGLIYNPNRPYIENNKDSMKGCFKVVQDPYVIGLAFSHQDKKVSSGVYAEIRIAQKWRKPIYIIDAKRIHSYIGTLSMTTQDRATNWARA